VRATKEQINMTQPMLEQSIDDRRKGVRRTVTILVSVVVAFFLLSFVQIVMMK
jgi:hypothetical protein